MTTVAGLVLAAGGRRRYGMPQAPVGHGGSLRPPRRTVWAEAARRGAGPRRGGRAALRHAQGAGRARRQPARRAGRADRAGGLRPGARRPRRAGGRRLADRRPRGVPKARAGHGASLLVERAVRTARAVCDPVLVVLGARAVDVWRTADLGGATVLAHRARETGMASRPRPRPR